MTDRDREELIDAYRVALTLEDCPARRQAAMDRMRELIASRSPERVRQMEKQRGLRAS